MLTPMAENQGNLAIVARIGGLTEHVMVLQQCWARSMSWRMLRMHDEGLSPEQRVIAKGLEHVWAPDINPRLKRSLLTFQWWRSAISEEARLLRKLFPASAKPAHCAAALLPA